MPARKSLKRRKSSKRLSKRLRTMKRNSKRMSRKSMRGGYGSCGAEGRKSKRSMRGGGECSRKKSMSGGSIGYKRGELLFPK